MILICFVISYSFFLILIKDDSGLDVFKQSYTLTLGEFEYYKELGMTRFLVLLVFTTLITLFLMNLLIAILSDAYELVTSEKKYYDGKAKIERSLLYERLAIFTLKLFKKEK